MELWMKTNKIGSRPLPHLLIEYILSANKHGGRYLDDLPIAGSRWEVMGYGRKDVL